MVYMDQSVSTEAAIADAQRTEWIPTPDPSKEA